MVLRPGSWNVAANGNLYVRAYHGQQSRWYQAAMCQKAGRIYEAGMTKEIIFGQVEGDIYQLMDDAYRVKLPR